jgi:anaerobic magnesium-protoporphyrin IX monomethyl ester cyclase
MKGIIVADSQVVLYEPVYWTRRKVERAPLSLLAISGLLDKEGQKISIVSRALYDKPEAKLLEDCKNAICLGITALTGYQITNGLQIAELVRQEYPHLPIVWGGWHPSLEPESTIASPYVDILVRGQGERTFTELVHALRDGKPLNGILGLSYKKNGKTFHNPDRILEDINNFPPLPYQLIDVEKVLSNDEYGDRVINYISSYGCTNQCAFCAEWAAHGRRWTGLSPQRMADDMERLTKDYKIDCVCINDTQFFLNKDRVKEFCEELIKRQLSVRWDNVEGNIRQLLTWEDEMWELIYNSGCRSMLVGSESGMPEALSYMNKALTVDETIGFAKKAHKNNMRILYSMMVGLPWDQDYKKTRKLIDEEVRLTLELADKIFTIGGNGRVLLFIYTPYPGSPMFQKSIELGLQPPNNLEGWCNWDLRHQTTPWISPKQAKFITFMATYIFLFLDAQAYGWITTRIRNKVERFLFKAIFKVFILLAKLRWRFKFFALPVDYYVFRWGKEFLGIT